MELSKQKKSRGITQNGEPNPIDIHVGKRLRLRRLLLGLSQDRLGQMIGLTFQQIQKYENGTNRISASRLWDIAVLLEVPISFFFEDMDQETLERSPRKLWGNAQLAEQLQETTEDPLTKSETLTMIRAYYKIAPSIRKCLYQIVMEMSKGSYVYAKKTDNLL